jgi:hypothetical protein
MANNLLTGDIISETAWMLPTPTPPLTSVLSDQEDAMPIVRIPLSQGKVAIVDEVDFPKVSLYRWWAAEHRRTWYAYTTVKDDNGKRHTVYMHRLITGASKGRKVDHKDHNGLNNRRSNLRVCTNAQNLKNRSGAPASNTSGYVGVWWCNKTNCWVAEVYDGGKKFRVGTFGHREHAARARDAAARNLNGEFVFQNFSEEREGR